MSFENNSFAVNEKPTNWQLKSELIFTLKRIENLFIEGQIMYQVKEMINDAVNKNVNNNNQSN